MPTLSSLLLYVLLISTASGMGVGGTPRCERERIYWQPRQRLHIADFAGSLGSKQHTAEANTGILTQSRPGDNPNTFVVEAQTFFDPCKSWFRRTESDSNTLAHEQLHFDITELFSRKLIRAYATEIHSHPDFVRQHERIYNKYWDMSRQTQDAYDREVYQDPDRQRVWNDKIAKALNELSAWEHKQIEIPMR